MALFTYKHLNGSNYYIADGVVKAKTADEAKQAVFNSLNGACAEVKTVDDIDVVKLPALKTGEPYEINDGQF